MPKSELCSIHSAETTSVFGEPRCTYPDSATSVATTDENSANTPMNPMVPASAGAREGAAAKRESSPALNAAPPTAPTTKSAASTSVVLR